MSFWWRKSQKMSHYRADRCPPWHPWVPYESRHLLDTWKDAKCAVSNEKREKDTGFSNPFFPPTLFWDYTRLVRPSLELFPLFIWTRFTDCRTRLTVLNSRITSAFLQVTWEKLLAPLLANHRIKTHILFTTPSIVLLIAFSTPWVFRCTVIDTPHHHHLDIERL